jgi:hypothetical protein
MQIAKVLAVYRVSPVLLVMEAEDGTVVELSLKEIEDGGHRLSDVAWKDLLETYQGVPVAMEQKTSIRCKVLSSRIIYARRACSMP